MSTPLIRPAVPSDAEAIARVHVQAWNETYPHILSAELLASVTVEDRTRRWQRILRQAEGQQFVAEAGGIIVGFVGTGPARDDDAPCPLELYSIYLLASHHGSGAGQALLDAAIGERPAYLWVAAENLRAQAFYRRNGFTADGSRIEQLRGEKLPELRMTRR